MTEVVDHSEKIKTYLYQSIFLALPKIYSSHYRGDFFQKFLNSKHKMDIKIEKIPITNDVFYLVNLTTRDGLDIDSLESLKWFCKKSKLDFKLFKGIKFLYKSSEMSHVKTLAQTPFEIFREEMDRTFNSEIMPLKPKSIFISTYRKVQRKTTMRKTFIGVKYPKPFQQNAKVVTSKRDGKIYVKFEF